MIRGFHSDTVEDSKCSTTIIFQLTRRHIADYFLFLYTKDINVQQRPDGCQKKFLSQNVLSISGLDIESDIKLPFLKYYKYNVFSIHFAKQLDNYQNHYRARASVSNVLFLTVLYP